MHTAHLQGRSRVSLNFGKDEGEGKTHEEAAHQDTPDSLARLSEVVVAVGGGDGGRALGRHGLSGLGVLENLEVVLGFDLREGGREGG